MPDEPLRIETDPDHGDVRALDMAIHEFNIASTNYTDGQELAIFVRDDDSELRGGLYATTWSGCLDIRLLWVREDERGRGLGSRLLMAAEDEARARGCHMAILDTHSFQAPAFYQRHGYRVVATLDGYPTGHSKLYFRKSLRDVLERTDRSPG